MASTVRNMLKTLHDRKCGTVVMLSDLIENGKVRHIYHKTGFYHVLFIFGGVGRLAIQSHCV